MNAKKVLSANGRNIVRIDIEDFSDYDGDFKLWIDRVGAHGYRFSFTGNMPAGFETIDEISEQVAEELAIASAKEPARDHGFLSIVRQAFGHGNSSKMSMYRLRVELNETEVWREIVIHSTENLHFLHLVIQAAMGWNDTHLYEFMQDGYAFQEYDDAMDDHVEDSQWMPLSKIFTKKDARVEYEYDFGDRWRHSVKLIEKIPVDEHAVFSTPGYFKAKCMDGAMACPPEDIGGIPGYEDLCDGTHPGRRHFRNFDPNKFSLKAANKRIKKEVYPPQPRQYEEEGEFLSP